ncbi:MAG: IPT/TIG domain-containing protein [Acidobacteria bacterium]|nr:IPT/TIG domain-containing protein [Acidobacteriota bacterium]
MRLLLRHNATMLFVVVLLAPAHGQVPPAQQVIASATLNFANNTITISGSNFKPDPVVRFGTVDLLVSSSNPSQIVAAFPAGSPASSLSPGTYLLSVRGRQVGAAATTFEVTIGAVGPVGPQGPPGPVGGLNGLREFTSSGTFPVPNGVNRLLVEAWAAGGGGGGADAVGSICASGGGGGGGGGYVRSVISVTAGQTYLVTIGLGGAGGPITSPGLNGGSSSFGNLLTVGGGSGGQPGNTTPAGSPTGALGGAGGAGGASDPLGQIQRPGSSGSPGREPFNYRPQQNYCERGFGGGGGSPVPGTPPGGGNGGSGGTGGANVPGPFTFFPSTPGEAGKNGYMLIQF